MADYTTLQADIVNTLAYDDIDPPLCIRLAESSLNRKFRVQAQETFSQATPANQQPDGLWYLTYPADYLEMRLVKRGDDRVEYVTPSQMTTDLSQYDFYTLANNLILLPSADPVTLYYFGLIPALSDSNATNWMTLNAYDALLYMSLAHACYQMDEQAKGDQYQQMGLSYATAAQDADDRARYSGSPLVQRG